MCRSRAERDCSEAHPPWVVANHHILARQNTYHFRSFKTYLALPGALEVVHVHLLPRHSGPTVLTSDHGLGAPCKVDRQLRKLPLPAAATLMILTLNPSTPEDAVHQRVVFSHRLQEGQGETD